LDAKEADQMMRRAHPLQLIGLAGIGLFLVAAFSPLSNAVFRWSAAASDIQPADAIVALGAGVDPDGTLSSESLVRTVRAVALYRTGRAPIIVFSGPGHEDGPIEARVRADLAGTLGVPSEAIRTETSALTTREEAVRIGGMLRAENVRRILLVTDSQHMRRADALFSRGGFQVFPATADARSGVGTSPGARLRLLRDLLGEWMALGYYRVAGYI
jgi:uncharacterized SAM-binding protein YcdF (DUF218 family)